MQGLRQLFAIEIPARGGAGRGGGLMLLSKVIEAMNSHSPTTREGLLKSGALVELSHTSMRDAAGSGGAAAAAAAAATGGTEAAQAAVEDIQGGALELLVTLWITFPDEMLELQGGGSGGGNDITRTASAGNSAKEKLWSLLRNAMAPKAMSGAPATAAKADGSSKGRAAEVRPASKLQLKAHSLLFRLLQASIAAKSPDSSTAYRIVVASLLENYGKEDVRNLVQTSLGRILEKTPRMPLGILVEPLMKQMRALGYTPADLAFHNVLARHPRLEPAQGLMIMDMMARVCVSDDGADCRESATKCLTSLLESLRDLPSAADFVDRLGRLALGIASAVAGPDGSSVVTRVPSGAGGASTSIGAGAGGSQVPLARKMAMVRLIDRIARLHSPAYNKHLHAHLLEALARKEQIAPDLVREFELLADTLSGKPRPPNTGSAVDEDPSAMKKRVPSSAEKSRVEGEGHPPGEHAKGRQRKDRFEEVRASEDSVLRSENNTPRAEGSPPPEGPPPQSHMRGGQEAAANRDAPIKRAPSGDSKRKGHGWVVKTPVDDGVEGAPDKARDQGKKEDGNQKEAAKEAKMAKRRERAMQKEAEERLRLEEEEKCGPKMTAEERRAAALERAKKLEEERKVAIVEKEKKREADMKALADREAELSAGKEQKMSAAERRAANLERAKKMEEEKKAAILEKRNKGAAAKLPNLLTQAEVSKQQSRVERERRRQALQQGRPSSGLAGKTLKDVNDSEDDDRMSMPDRDRSRLNRMRPPSAKTRKREEEIAEIKRKRQLRILEKEAEEVRDCGHALLLCAVAFVCGAVGSSCYFIVACTRRYRSQRHACPKSRALPPQRC